MPAMQSRPRYDKIAEQWRDLAERRLQHLKELYRSGSWQRYYTRELLTLRMRDAITTVKVWRALAARLSADDEVRPAA